MATPYDPNNPMKPKPPVTQPVAPQFQAARQNLNQRFATQGQQSNDAIRRRFAAMGALGSGAAIKAQQQAQEGITAQREQAAQGLDMQEVQMNNQMAEAEAQRALQSRGLDLQEANQRNQTDLARQELGLKADEQAFNTGTALKQQGFNYNLASFLSPEMLARIGISEGQLRKDLQRSGFGDADAERQRYLRMRMGA